MEVKRIVVLGVILALILSGIFFVTSIEANGSPGTTLYVGGTGPDNYTKIQDAVDDATDGDIVFVYNGIYYEDVVVDKAIFLRGETQNETVIDGAGAIMVIRILANQVKISNFTIRNGSLGVVGAVYGTLLDEICISHCTIMKNTGDGINFQGTNNLTISFTTIHSNGDRGIAIYGGHNTTILHCNIYENKMGILISQSHNTTITSSVIHSNKYEGINFDITYDNRVTDCSMYANHDGMILTYTENSLIHACNFSDQVTGIFFNVRAINITVSHCTITNNNYSGIQLNSGGKLHTISHCTFSHSPYGIRQATKSLITNCTFFNHSSVGIEIRGGNHISNNTIYECHYAISLFRSSNTVSENNLHHNDWGVYVWHHSDNNIISGNSISYNAFDGIHLVSALNNKISGNTIHDNQYGYGIVLSDSENITVTENHIFNNTQGILSENTNNNTIIDNIFRHNDIGVNLQFSYGTIIRCNTFLFNWQAATFAYREEDTPAGNIWNRNYWDLPLIFPRPIIGELWQADQPEPTTWINFDWMPRILPTGW